MIEKMSGLGKYRRVGTIHSLEHVLPYQQLYPAEAGVIRGQPGELANDAVNVPGVCILDCKCFCGNLMAGNANALQ